METQSDGVESEQISEAFLCCVCLDILYKPIVLACGHISCFWCVHRSMSGLRESNCPICRHPYHHFPNICQMLHFLLLKMYPVAYKGRENQILEEEKEMGFFSPKVDDLCASHTNEELNHLDDQAQSSSTSKQENLSKIFPSAWKGEPHANMEQPESVAFVQDGSTSIAKQITTESFETNCNENLSTNLSSTRKGESYANMEQPESVAFVQDGSLTIAKQNTTESLETNCNENLSTNLSSTRKGKPYANKEQPESVAYVQDGSPTIAKQITTENFEATCTVGVEDKNLPHLSCNRICQRVSIVDVLCTACKQLLFRPAVLNCGHVYCETCIMPAGKAIRCQVCQSPHPRGIPKVCLEFDHFLEEQFPKEYTARRGMVQLKQVQFQHESPPTCGAQFSLPTEDDFFHWWGDHGSKVHIGAGCDFCGMYPIIGDRYRCKDCKEAIGFDLCGDCYNTCSKLPGRFNQQHTPDHRFEIVKSNTIRNIMLRLLRGHLGDGTPAPSLSNDELDNPENVIPFLTSSDRAQGTAENGLGAPSTSIDTEEPQNDDTL